MYFLETELQISIGAIDLRDLMAWAVSDYGNMHVVLFDHDNSCSNVTIRHNVVLVCQQLCRPWKDCSSCKLLLIVAAFGLDEFNSAGSMVQERM
jgi:hypothetical protein